MDSPVRDVRSVRTDLGPGRDVVRGVHIRNLLNEDHGGNLWKNWGNLVGNFCLRTPMDIRDPLVPGPSIPDGSRDLRPSPRCIYLRGVPVDSPGRVRGRRSSREP